MTAGFLFRRLLLATCVAGFAMPPAAADQDGAAAPHYATEASAARKARVAARVVKLPASWRPLAGPDFGEGPSRIGLEEPRKGGLAKKASGRFAAEPKGALCDMTSPGRRALVRTNPELAELLASRGHFRIAATCACTAPPAVPLADTSLTQTAAPSPVTAGQPLTFTIGISNAGPNTATSLTLSDTLVPSLAFVSVTPSSPTCVWSSGSRTVNCSWSSLAAGGSTGVTIVTTVSAAASGSISNTVAVSAATLDPSLGNNSVTRTVTVAALYPGATPSDNLAGSPLLVRKSPGPAANIDLSWGGACGTSSTGYALYEGVLGSFYGHSVFNGICNLNGFSASAQASGAGDRYYLVVPVSGTNAEEGSYGTSSSGTQIPPGATPCQPTQDSGVCPAGGGNRR